MNPLIDIDTSIDDLARPLKQDADMTAVAADIAAEAHLGQCRRNGMAYIHHPGRVRIILDQLNATGAQKAIGLLHDVIEDSKFDSRGKLFKRLSSDLIEKFKPQTDAEKQTYIDWANHVCDGVVALTNDSVLYESKSIAQVEKVKTMSEEFRAIKIIDQAATVIEDGILHSNLRDFAGLIKERGFACKGYEISRVCYGKGKPAENPQKRLTQQCCAFYDQVYYYFMKSYRLAQRAENKREEGNIPAADILFEAAAQRNRDFIDKGIMDQMLMTAQSLRGRFRPEGIEQEQEAMEHFYSPNFSDPAKNKLEKGIVRVTCLKSDKRVVSYSMVVDPKQKQSGSPANMMMEKLRENLLKMDLGQNYSTHVEIHNRHFARPKSITMPKARAVRVEGIIEDKTSAISTRDFRLVPPVALDTFLRKANASELGAIDDEFATKLKIVAVQSKIGAPSRSRS